MATTPCEDSPNTSKNRRLPDAEDPIRMNFCNRIAINMMLENLQDGEAKQENAVSSPMSINILLNMLINGLRDGSTGQIELLNALDMKSVAETNSVSSRLMTLVTDSAGASSSGNITSPVAGEPVLSMANGVWTDLKHPIKERFGEIAAQTYRARTRSYDFVNNPEKVIQKVNSWAEKRTNGLIKDLISPGSLSDDIIAVLANTLYFKGAWKVPFRSDETREKYFYDLRGKSRSVPFMNQVGLAFYKALDGFKLLKLPYKSGGGDKSCKELALYVFLPDETDGLKCLLEKFDADPSLIHSSCNEIEDAGMTLCSISVPKFKISCGFEPSDAMKKMGLGLERLGLLTNMVDLAARHARATVMVQKSCVEVNENGTVAVSATYAKVGLVAARRTPRREPASLVYFVADHPFFFVIKDGIIGATLFSGTVCSPGAS